MVSYYLKNKHKWRKGGIYYKYKPVNDRPTKILFTITQGKFIILFD